MRLLILILFLFVYVGCATLPGGAKSARVPEPLQPLSFKSQGEAVRWIASVDQSGLRTPKEIRLFESKTLREEKVGNRPISLLRVRANANGTRQIFERCEIAAAEFARDRERASVSECKPIGSVDGYAPERVATFVAQSAGQALGPDWQSLKSSLASTGVAASGAVAFFILDPTKLLAGAAASLAAISGANVVVEARRQNVLDPQSATLLSWNASSPELSIVSVNGSLFDNERVLRIALRRIDNGQEALKPLAPNARGEAFDLIPIYP